MHLRNCCALDQESGQLSAKQAAEIFRQLSDLFGRAAGQADFTSASLDVMRHMLQQAGGAAAPPDDAVRAMLFGHAPAEAFEIDGATYEADWAVSRDKEYRHVFELQKVAPLAALFALYDAAGRLIEGKGDATAAIGIIETSSAALPVVEVPKSFKVKGKRRDNLNRLPIQEGRRTDRQAEKDHCEEEGRSQGDRPYLP